MIGKIAMWLPLIAILAVWIYFMRGLRKRSGEGMRLSQESNDLLRQVVASNERIAAALETKTP